MSDRIGVRFVDDLTSFRCRHRLGQVVVVNVSSTELPLSLYGFAVLRADCAHVDFTPLPRSPSSPTGRRCSASAPPCRSSPPTPPASGAATASDTIRWTRSGPTPTCAGRGTTRPRSNTS
ncbi:hypothetical protein ACIBG8_04290 [Nonomuraea sp. NPDC050556]|uniref:hypothetical protein n=1 Tax=Nonomuraea sp. NPDC050556 TaxID=3364369 RepID=UPI00379A762F